MRTKTPLPAILSIALSVAFASPATAQDAGADLTGSWTLTFTTSQGTVNIGALLGLLERLKYKGYIALEAVHQEYMNTVHEDVLTEIIKLRNFCLEYSGARAGAAVTSRRF